MTLLINANSWQSFQHTPSTLSLTLMIFPIQKPLLACIQKPLPQPRQDLYFSFFLIIPFFQFILYILTSFAFSKHADIHGTSLLKKYGWFPKSNYLSGFNGGGGWVGILSQWKHLVICGDISVLSQLKENTFLITVGCATKYFTVHRKNYPAPNVSSAVWELVFSVLNFLSVHYFLRLSHTQENWTASTFSHSLDLS